MRRCQDVNICKMLGWGRCEDEEMSAVGLSA